MNDVTKGLSREAGAFFDTFMKVCHFIGAYKIEKGRYGANFVPKLSLRKWK